MSAELLINGKKVVLEKITRTRDAVEFTLNGTHYQFRGTRQADGTFTLEAGEERQRGTLWPTGKGGFKIQLGIHEVKISPVMAAVSTASTELPLSPTAPMPGVIRQVLVQKGDIVKKGQALAVMEAMKLQTTLAAGGDAVVIEVLVNAGELVTEGAELVKLSAKTS